MYRLSGIGRQDSSDTRRTVEKKKQGAANASAVGKSYRSAHPLPRGPWLSGPHAAHGPTPTRAPSSLHSACPRLIALRDHGLTCPPSPTVWTGCVDCGSQAPRAAAPPCPACASPRLAPPRVAPGRTGETGLRGGRTCHHGFFGKFKTARYGDPPGNRTPHSRIWSPARQPWDIEGHTSHSGPRTPAPSGNPQDHRAFTASPVMGGRTLHRVA